MATNMKSLNGYGFDAAALGGKTLAQLMLTLYPVGAVYISANSTSPASLFGGTWEQLKDRFLLGAGSTYTAGSTGGEETHTLTVDEMPTHRHIVPIGGSGSYTTTGYETTGSGYLSPGVTANAAETSGVGESNPHNNMPPYLAVYMWKRVS